MSRDMDPVYWIDEDDARRGPYWSAGHAQGSWVQDHQRKPPPPVAHASRRELLEELQSVLQDLDGLREDESAAAIDAAAEEVAQLLWGRAS